MFLVVGVLEELIPQTHGVERDIKGGQVLS
jgi:hypothetical protein